MDLKVELLYVQDDGSAKRPYFYNCEPTEDDLIRNGHEDKVDRRDIWREVIMHNARQRQSLTLDKNSFQLFNWGTAMSTDDFYNNEEKIKEVYYQEMMELIKNETGAEHVVIFNHMVRNGEGGTPYSRRIHSDTCALHCKRFYADMVGNKDPKYEKGRFMMISTWRNICEEPIVNDHLGMCDQGSVVSPDDFLLCDYYSKGKNIITYNHTVHYRLEASNWRHHKWYYYPNMVKDEVLLFKQWDSDPLKSARTCFHTAFHDDGGNQTYKRQSIECRAFAFFPNTSQSC